MRETGINSYKTANIDFFLTPPFTWPVQTQANRKLFETCQKVLGRIFCKVKMRVILPVGFKIAVPRWDFVTQSSANATTLKSIIHKLTFEKGKNNKEKINKQKSR